MLFENRNNDRFRAVRLNFWVSQVSSLFNSMAAACFLISLLAPVLDGKWPPNTGLWLTSGVMLFLASILAANHLRTEEQE